MALSMTMFVDVLAAQGILANFRHRHRFAGRRGRWREDLNR